MTGVFSLFSTWTVTHLSKQCRPRSDALARWVKISADKILNIFANFSPDNLHVMSNPIFWEH